MVLLEISAWVGINQLTALQMGDADLAFFSCLADTGASKLPLAQL